MKDTIDGIIGLAIVSGIVVGSFISGYAIAENRHLRGDIKLMGKAMSELVKTTDTINNKEKVPEDKTEE